MAKRWNFHCALSDRGDHAIERWRANLSKKGRAKLDRTLDHLKFQPKDEWGRPAASPLGDHIYVIRFADENGTPWRLFGHFYDGHHAFVATLGGTERDGNYLPSDYHKRSVAAQLHCNSDFGSRTHACLRGCDICTGNDVEHVGGGLPGQPLAWAIPRVGGP